MSIYSLMYVCAMKIVVTTYIFRIIKYELVIHVYFNVAKYHLSCDYETQYGLRTDKIRGFHTCKCEVYM